MPVAHRETETDWADMDPHDIRCTGRNGRCKRYDSQPKRDNSAIQQFVHDI
jgi:hypothetical protein